MIIETEKEVLLLLFIKAVPLSGVFYFLEFPKDILEYTATAHLHVKPPLNVVFKTN